MSAGSASPYRYEGLISYARADEPVAAWLHRALEAWIERGAPSAVGIGLNNLGNLANRKGDHKAAEDYCQRALENDESIYDRANAVLAYPLTCVGEALLGQKRPRDALVPLGRAFELRNRPDISKAALAWTQWLYGRALTESGKDADVGIEYVNAARDVFVGMGEAAKSELRDIEAWLAARGSE